MKISMGMCVASGCSNTSVLAIVNGLLQASKLVGNTTKLNVICADTDKTMDASAVVAL